MKTTEIFIKVINTKIKELEQGKGYAQTITIQEPDRSDGFGNLIAKGGIFEVNHFAKDPAKLFYDDQVLNKICKAEFWVNSNVYKKPDGNEVLITQLSIKSLIPKEA